MRTIKRLLFVKGVVLIVVLCIFVAGAVPKYINLNKHREMSECQRNQVIVETALAIAFAENLSHGNSHLPQKLSPNMFDDGIIPTCPVNNIPIAFDSLTGAAYCPNCIDEHKRIY